MGRAGLRQAGGERGRRGGASVAAVRRAQRRRRAGGTSGERWLLRDSVLDRILPLSAARRRPISLSLITLRAVWHLSAGSGEWTEGDRPEAFRPATATLASSLEKVYETPASVERDRASERHESSSGRDEVVQQVQRAAALATADGRGRPRRLGLAVRRLGTTTEAARSQAHASEGSRAEEQAGAAGLTHSVNTSTTILPSTQPRR